MAEITAEELLKIYINIKGYNALLKKTEIAIDNGEELLQQKAAKESLIVQNEKLMEQIENIVNELKESRRLPSKLSDKIACEFSDDSNVLMARNREFKDKNAIPINYASQLFNRILEMHASEDRWIQDIENANIRLIGNAMRRLLVIYNDSITDTVADERTKNIDLFEKYTEIKSHFNSDFFEIFQAVKNDHALEFLDKTLDDMIEMPEDKIENMFNLSLVQPFVDYYAETLSNLDLSNEPELQKLFFPLQQITPSAYQRVTRYPMMLSEIQGAFSKFISTNGLENDEKIIDLQNKISQVLNKEKAHSQTLNKKRYDDEKAYASHALDYIREVITTVDWDIKLKSLFGRHEVQSNTHNITSFMRSMLIALNELDNKVSVECKKRTRMSEAGAIDEDKIRTEVMQETFKTVVGIAQDRESSPRKILSEFLKKDGPKVNLFYENLKAMQGKPFLATEKLSQMIEPPRNRYEIQINIGNEP